MAADSLPMNTENSGGFLITRLPISSSCITFNANTATATNPSSLKRKRPPKLEIPNVLREIQTEKHRDTDFTVKNESLCFTGCGVGVASVKGKKKVMEDRHKIVPSITGNSKKGFFGVYDGHGGTKAADFVADNLHTKILKMIEDCKGSIEKEEAIKAGYLEADEEFLKQGVGSGACCVTALIEQNEILISNLGDCRAVLCRGGVAKALTKDHRVEQEDEQKRIEEKGGYVEFHRGAWRIHGILSVSRSIGDAHLKDWVTADPDTKTIQLTSDMEYLILASDGLWEQVCNQEAVDTVLRICHKDKLGASGDRQTGTGDNCGCVNTSPSSKLRRISLVKQHRGATCLNKISNVCNENEDEFPGENGSPPSKLRRISMVKRVDTRIESPTKGNRDCSRKTSSYGLSASCKELANLAVSRGSLDDITVMVIDLDNFRCKN